MNVEQLWQVLNNLIWTLISKKSWLTNGKLKLYVRISRFIFYDKRKFSVCYQSACYLRCFIAISLQKEGGIQAKRKRSMASERKSTEKNGKESTAIQILTKKNCATALKYTLACYVRQNVLCGVSPMLCRETSLVHCKN